MATDNRAKLPIIVTMVIAVGVNRVNPADFFMKNAHTISRSPAETRKIQATAQAPFRAGPSRMFMLGKRGRPLTL